MPFKRCDLRGCDTVQQIDGSVARARSSCGGNILPLPNHNAFRTARLARRLGGGYYVHSSIIGVASTVDRSQPIDWNVTREVPRKDGTNHVFGFDHHLREAFENSQTKDDLDRVWLAGRSITLGDTLSKNGYFLPRRQCQYPLLELVRIFGTASRMATVSISGI
jgi:hypothetical protein